MASQAALSYSKALVQLAEEKNLLTQVQSAAESILPKLKIPEMLNFLRHPKTPAIAKKEVLAKLILDNAPQEFKNFLNLLVDRGQIPNIVPIMENVVDQAIKAQGFEVVTLITAQPLTDLVKEGIREELEERWSTRIFFKYRENPSLIGGVVIERGDKLYDGSLNGQLKKLKNLLVTETDRSI